MVVRVWGVFFEVGPFLTGAGPSQWTPCCGQDLVYYTGVLGACLGFFLVQNYIEILGPGVDPMSFNKSSLKHAQEKKHTI